MDRSEPIKPDDFVELFHGSFVSAFAPDIITRGKYVACIDAHGHTPLILHAVDDFAKMIKPIAECRSLAGSRFKYALDNVSPCLIMRPIKRFDDDFDTILFSLAHVCSGVKIEIRDSKRF